jgi:hypothetical protein
MASPSLAIGADRHDHHGLPVHEVVLLLETDESGGLTHAESASRLDRFGPNVLPRIGQRGPVRRFLLQFHHPLIYVLLGAAAVTLLLGDLVDFGVIVGVDASRLPVPHHTGMGPGQGDQCLQGVAGSCSCCSPTCPP